MCSDSQNHFTVTVKSWIITLESASTKAILSARSSHSHS